MKIYTFSGPPPIIVKADDILLFPEGSKITKWEPPQTTYPESTVALMGHCRICRKHIYSDKPYNYDAENNAYRCGGCDK